VAKQLMNVTKRLVRPLLGCRDENGRERWKCVHKARTCALDPKRGETDQNDTFG